MRRAQHPSGLSRRRQRLRRHTQQQPGHAGGLGCERQLAARHEIELARLPPDFQHHGSERIAGQRIGRGPKRALDVNGVHREEVAMVSIARWWRGSAI